MNKINVVKELMNNGYTISQAFAICGVKHVSIPFSYNDLQFDVLEMPFDTRIKNALMRNHLTTIGDVIRYVEDGNKITSIHGLGVNSIKLLMENILDVLWDCLTNDEKEMVLIENVM